MTPPSPRGASRPVHSGSRYNVSKAVIPQLRAQGGGTVVHFSSVGGRVGGSPGIASYQAAKFAVDGFSRVLAVETAPFAQ